MLNIAYEHKAELIVAVEVIQADRFLEKGRKGMASTFLVRMKVGYRLSMPGVSELYRNRLKLSYLASLFAAALFPIAMVVRLSPLIREWYRLIALRLKILIGL